MMTLSEVEKQELIRELEQFHDKFDYYRALVLAQKGLKVKSLTLPNKQLREIRNLSSELQRKYGSLKEVIEKYGGSTEVLLQGGEYKCEAFTSAFSYTGFDPVALEVVMDTAIAAINIAIGNLQSLKLPEASQIHVPEDSAQMANFLFDKMQFHPKIVNASRALFEDEHYAQAIFEAFKAVENFVQDKSGLTLYGTNLMERVFNEENPIIKVPEAGHYYKEVQKGFKHLFIGASQGIRNPKAHKEIIQKDPYITLQYLGFFSFLLKRIDYWETGVS